MVSLFSDSGDEFGKWIRQYASPPRLCLAAPMHCPLAMALLLAWRPAPLLPCNEAMLKKKPCSERSSAAHPAWCSVIPSASAESQSLACSAHGVALWFGVSLLKASFPYLQSRCLIISGAFFCKHDRMHFRACESYNLYHTPWTWIFGFVHLLLPV